MRTQGRGLGLREAPRASFRSQELSPTHGHRCGPGRAGLGDLSWPRLGLRCVGWRLRLPTEPQLVPSLSGCGTVSIGCSHH